jgi:hypothetical protein
MRFRDGFWIQELRRVATPFTPRWRVFFLSAAAAPASCCGFLRQAALAMLFADENAGNPR